MTSRAALFFSKADIFCLIFGFFCLLNPVVIIVDILPDFIGYLLIALALSKIKYLDGYIESAVSKIKLLAGFSAAKTVCTIFVPGMSMNDSLTISLIFGIFEVSFAVVFARELFSGFAYLAERNDNEAILSKVSGARFMALFGLITRAVLSVLPQFFALPLLLSESDLFETTFTPQEINQFYNVAMLLCAFVAFGLMIWSGKELYSFFKTLGHDERFSDSLSAKFAAFKERNPLIDRFARFKVALALTGFGSFFYLDFTIDSIHVLPPFVGTLLFIAALWVLLPRERFLRTGIIFFAVLAVQLGAMLCFDKAVLDTWSGAALALLTSVCAVYATVKLESLFAKRADEDMGCIVGNAFNAQRCALIAALGLSVAYRFTGNEQLDTARFFVMLLWFVLQLRVSYALSGAMNELKKL